jgi:hypothetical protein
LFIGPPFFATQSDDEFRDDGTIVVDDAEMSPLEE